MKQIAIIGLGLIGGSLTKALKAKGYKVIGIDKSSKTIQLALKEKVINNGYTKFNSKSLENIDLIFICTPLHLITDYLTKLSKVKLKNGVIITDVGSTKSEICKHANKVFTTHHCFIGSHPMAGTEKTGFISSKKNLFKNCAWVLTPTYKNNQLLTVIKTIIKKTGAKPILTTPKKHDEAIALISHLPLLTSVGLCEITKDSNMKDFASKLVSSGFRDITRIASGNPAMNSNLLISNSLILKQVLPIYLKKLNNILKMARTKSKSLHKKLRTVSIWRSKLYNLKGENNLLLKP